jgi:RimJ/RimL family protein N-acetyltransferase
MADQPADNRRQGIRGELVFLRPLEPADLPALDVWHRDGDFRRLLGEPPRSLDDRRRRHDDQFRERGDTLFSFAICRLEDGLLVGRTDLFEIDKVNGSAAFGIGIGPRELRGLGYGGDAVNALVDFAFGELRLERVWLLTDEENVRAQATYRRAGFVEEARLRRAFVDRGRHIDAVRLSMLRSEWAALPRRRSWDWLAALDAAEEPG